MSLYVFLHFPPIIIILSSNPLFHSYVLVHVSCVRCDIPLHSIIDSFAGWKKLIFIPSFVRRNDYNAHLSLLTKSSSPHIHSTYIWILMNTNETEKISWTHFQFCMMFFPLHSSSSLLDGKQFFCFSAFHSHTRVTFPLHLHGVSAHRKKELWWFYFFCVCSWAIQCCCSSHCVNCQKSVGFAAALSDVAVQWFGVGKIKFKSN